MWQPTAARTSSTSTFQARSICSKKLPQPASPRSSTPAPQACSAMRWCRRGQAGGLDHRRRHGGAKKYLWRHQGGRGGSVPAVRAQSFASRHRAAHLAFFPKRTTIARYARPTPTPTSREQVPLSPRRYRKTWSARICWRRHAPSTGFAKYIIAPLRHSRAGRAELATTPLWSAVTSGLRGRI